MLDFISQPWPWYVAGPLIGLIVPLLLILGNKSFGISSSLRHTCASCFPSTIKFFQYDWKKEMWNLFFVLGVALGAFFATYVIANPNPIHIQPEMQELFKSWGITDFSQLVPTEIFSWENLLTLKGFFMLALGGFMVGFGSRYAGGCTSGHAIMGISSLQLSSLIATIAFMIGGFIMSFFILPLILS